VLVAPLDWGLGHSTRCIPIITALLAQGFEVLIAAENESAALLKKEFPTVKILPLKGYRISYAINKKYFFWKMLWQLPKILKAIVHENKWLQKTIETHKIDIVIADNRFGMSSKNATCIFITHQLCIKTGNAFIEKIAQKINYFFINKFNKCWVIDKEGENNLAGDLSHPFTLPKTPITYIGILSRFKKAFVDTQNDLLLLLSGPEPQRTIFENKLLLQIKDIPLKITLVRGLPNSTNKIEMPNLITYNHLPAAELNNVILASNFVVSRSGYTTLMDLATLQKPSIFIPTPGQTEQVYLAKLLAQKKYCIAADQNDFNLKKQMVLWANATFNIYPVYTNDELKNAISMLK
jgi:uncharacterized protein (TIGR00661 family)